MGEVKFKEFRVFVTVDDMVKQINKYTKRYVKKPDYTPFYANVIAGSVVIEGIRFRSISRRDGKLIIKSDNNEKGQTQILIEEQKIIRIDLLTSDHFFIIDLEDIVVVIDVDAETLYKILGINPENLL